MNNQTIQEWAILAGELIQYLPQQDAYEKLIQFLIRSSNSREGVVSLCPQREGNWEVLSASFVLTPEFQRSLEQVFHTASPCIKADLGQIYFPLFDSHKRIRGVLCLIRESQSLPFGSFEGKMVGKVLPLFQSLLDRTPISKKREKKLHLGRFIGNSETMKQVYRSIEKVMKQETTVAILGESGTGKELVAQALHQYSQRAEKAFIDVNCAAIPKELMESEFFGHEKGAFSGATGIKKGKFELAQGGTLFLDEIAELSLDLQAKLLRALQEKKIWRVGGEKPISINVRVITATHQHIEKMVENGEFRSDLFYRLHVFPILLPPLRERNEDIMLLAHHFLQKLAPHIQGFQPKALNILQSYSWPGNIRELGHAIERAVLHHEGDQLLSADFLLSSKQQGKSQTWNTQEKGGREGKQTLEESIRESIYRALSRNRFNKTQTAEELGIFRSKLHRLMSKYSVRSA